MAGVVAFCFRSSATKLLLTTVRLYAPANLGTRYATVMFQTNTRLMLPNWKSGQRQWYVGIGGFEPPRRYMPAPFILSFTAIRPCLSQLSYDTLALKSSVYTLTSAYPNRLLTKMIQTTYAATERRGFHSYSKSCNRPGLPALAHAMRLACSSASHSRQ